MHKFYRIKRDILACLMACMFIGGMGVDTYAAEVVDAQGAEGSGTEDLAAGSEGFRVSVSRNVSCTVEADGTVTYAAVPDNRLPVPDDGMLYLFELDPYEYDLTSDTGVIKAMKFDSSEHIWSFSFPVNFRQADTRLYSKFAVGIKSGGALYMVTEPTYITNPEALAQNTRMRYPRSKKSTQGEEFNNLYLDGTYGPVLAWPFKTIQVLNTGDGAGGRDEGGSGKGRAADVLYV